jgi:O-antigen biosynthesis protein
VIQVPKRGFDARVMLESLRLARSFGRAMGKLQYVQRFEVELTRGLGLFDREYYLSQLGSADLQGLSPLKHYVMHGDAAGLRPCPMFDVAHYDAQFPRRRGLNRLLHYGLVGRAKGGSTSPWFDAEYYLRSNPDVVHSGLDPLCHFQRWGWREGRSPLPGLDMRRLLSAQPAMRVRGHALAVFNTDWIAGYMAAEAHDAAQRVRPPELLSDPALPDMLSPDIWRDVQPRRWDRLPEVDVIVPVYAGLQETLRCLHSVLTAPVGTPHQLIVINDAGPLPELSAMLRTLAARGLIVLEQNRQNLGFVRTVNKGLRLNRDHDVVILNSDTEVYNDWLDRLLDHAAQFPRLATITPLSNNATICSYPETLSDNRLPLEIAPAEIDALTARVNRGRHIEVPTGVGFCMYMRRAALREVGLLDERHFGRGYGEENDFCQRAIKAGWRNAIAGDVYVRHVGSVSFKGEAAERTAQAIKTLERLHPGYDQTIQNFIAADPLRQIRARLDIARLVSKRQKRNVLLVCHHRGGGTERHLVEQTEALQAAGAGVFELRPMRDANAVSLSHPGMFALANVGGLSLTPDGLLEEALQELDISELHIHHLIDFPPSSAAALMKLARKHGLRVRLAIHDYFAICPRVNLVNAEGQHCGSPSQAECNRCLAQDGLIEQTGPIGPWRQGYAELFAAAHEVLVPAVDVQRRLAPLAPKVRLIVQPHEPDPPRRISASPLVPLHQPVRVLAIGAINRIKGYDVLMGLAQAAAQQPGSLEVALLGYSQDDGPLLSAGVQLHGRYYDHELMERIASIDPHIILVPSIWPETYCYVLSGALRSGRRVAVFDLGAQADRARAHDPQHLVLPLALASAPAELARHLERSARAPDRSLPDRGVRPLDGGSQGVRAGGQQGHWSA